MRMGRYSPEPTENRRATARSSIQPGEGNPDGPFRASAREPRRCGETASLALKPAGLGRSTEPP